MKFELDYYGYKNGLKDVPAEQKLLLTLFLFLGSYFAILPIKILIVIWILFLLNRRANIPILALLKWFAFISVFLGFGLPAILFQVGSSQPIEETLLVVKIANWFIYITGQSFSITAETFFRSLSSVASLLFILFTTPFIDILHVLKKLKVPVFLLDLLLSMYLFIFLFFDVAGNMISSMKSRLANSSWKSLFKSMGYLFVQLFVTSFERYKLVSLAYQSRGYDGQLYYESKSRNLHKSKIIIEGLTGIVCLLLLDLWMRRNGV